MNLSNDSALEFEFVDLDEEAKDDNRGVKNQRQEGFKEDENELIFKLDNDEDKY